MTTLRGLEMGCVRRAGLVTLLSLLAGVSQPVLAAQVSDDGTADPILALAQPTGEFRPFRDAIAHAVEISAAVDEASAGVAEAGAVKREALQGRFPTVDLSLGSSKVLARQFLNDDNNVIERFRPDRRTDAIVAVQQPLFDFGALGARIASARARLIAAGAQAQVVGVDVALRSIGAWYEVFGYRALEALGKTFVADRRKIATSLQVRIAAGASAQADQARIDSYIASASSQLAGFVRAREDAEARFTQLFGEPPPAHLSRIKAMSAQIVDAQAAGLAPAPPEVRAAEAVAEADRKAARAARADTLPALAARVDAGRYGVLEDRPDYDVRAQLQLTLRLFGGVDPRADQARARADGSAARARLVREEAARDVAIARSDIAALEDQLDASRAAYVAARMSRDVTVERFAYERGSLFDVVAVQDSHAAAAIGYIRTLIELDTARYALLARQGRLLDVLSIDTRMARR